MCEFKKVGFDHEVNQEAGFLDNLLKNEGGCK